MFNDLRPVKGKISFLPFFADLAEESITEGLRRTSVRPTNRAPPPNKKTFWCNTFISSRRRTNKMYTVSTPQTSKKEQRLLVKNATFRYGQTVSFHITQKI